MQPSDLVCLQSTHQGFSAATNVQSDCGVTYIRDFVLERRSETVNVNDAQYEITRTSRMSDDGKVLSWSAYGVQKR